MLTPSNKLPVIKIGSRGSDLALWQANFVKSELEKLGERVEINIIKTQGDQIQHLSFDKLEGKGFFTKEIEDALLKKEVDLAVHSHKDLPTTSPEGLTIAAVSEREDPSDLLLIHPSAFNPGNRFSLKENATVGTSSARRKSQLLSFLPSVRIEDIRGNVPTRVQRLKEGKYDAILIAAAGIERLKLDLSGLHVTKLSPDEFIPAPAQGVLALQVRETDTELIQVLQKLNSTKVQREIAVERKILNLFDGGCQLPLGAYCHTENNKLVIRAAKAKDWNTFPVRVFEVCDENEAPESIAERMVAKISNLKPCSVFITRDLEEGDIFFRGLNEQGFKVNGSSLINTNLVRFSSIPATDWIFFSSRNSVKFFFEQHPEVAEKVKYAVIGKGTESVLRSYGKIPSFVGTQNNMTDIANSFSSQVSGVSILFPQAKESLQSIQKQLSFSNKVFDLYVYHTQAKEDFNLQKADLLVFTSPSNVEAYHNKYKIEPSQKVISIGPSTGKALQRLGTKEFTLPRTFDEIGLLEAVFTIA